MLLPAKETGKYRSNLSQYVQVRTVSGPKTKRYT
jgi:hypothetical protein